MLASHESRVCSQNGEDGIVEYLLSVVGEGAKFCVEFGFGNEACTLNLLSNKRWAGALFDANPIEYLRGIQRYFNREDISVKNIALTPKNINEAFIDAGVPKTIDVLSIDVDGVDLYLLKAIRNRIRILICEYNASFGPELSVSIPYMDEFNRMKFHPQYHGASLRALTKVAKMKSLKLVGCESCGINAFFVEKKANIEEVSVEEAFKNHSKRNGVWRDQLKELGKFVLEKI